MFLLLCGAELLGQTKEINLKTLTLQEALEVIEARSDYVFNYDPTLIEGYVAHAIMDISDIDQLLTKVLYDSPFRYETDGETILIYYPEPQSYRICGTLRDAMSQDPLVGANIIIFGTSSGTQSDALGYFEFDYKGDKHELVEISYLGYKAIQLSLQELQNGDCPTSSFEVNENLFGSEIIISDYLLDGIALGNDFMGFKMDFEQLSDQHSTVEHDVLKTAQLLPGITSIDDSATNIQIRGSDPGQNLVLWEGVPLYNAGHVFGMISAINPFAVDEVSIYKGAYSPQYDNRVGGILDISLSDGVVNGFHGSVGSTMTELHGNLSLPLITDQVTLELSGRRSINGVFDSPTLSSYTDKVFQFSLIDDQSRDEAFLRTEQSLQFSDWNAKVVYRPSDRLMLKAGFYGNGQDFNYSFWLEDDTFLSEDIIELSTQVMTLAAEFTITDNWTSKLSAYQSSYDNSYAQSQTENDILISRNDQLNSIQEESISFSNEFSFGSQWLLDFGYEYNHKDLILDLGNEINFDSEFVPNEEEDGYFHNIFQSFKFTSDKWQVDGGNRSTYYQEANRWFHSPRINLKYALNQNFTIKSDAGIYHQFISQLTNVGANLIKVDNPLWILNASGSSLSQKASKFATGFVYQKGQWLIDVDGYYNLIDGINTLSPQLGILTTLNGFSQGTSSVLGLDALIKKRWSSGINTWLSYSLGFANYNFSDFQETQLPASNDIRHNLSLVSSYSFKNFKFSLNANYHTGLPFSEARLVKNTDDPEAEPPFEYWLEYDSFNSERLDYYLRIDLNASYRFEFKSIEDFQIELSCSVLNLLNRSNIVERGYSIDYNEITTTYKSIFIQKSLLARTPLVLLRIFW